MTIVDKEVVGEGDLPKIEYPDVPLGIFLERVFKDNLELHGDAKWLTDVSKASGLRKRGFQAGDNVIVIASNLIESPLMSLGAQRAGGFQACFNPLNLPADQIEVRMMELKTKFILTDFIFSSWIEEFTKKYDFIKEVFVAGDVPVPSCAPFDHLLQDPGDECPGNLDEIGLDSTCWMPFTSGTTGLPKGIIRTHRVVIKSLLR